MEKLVDIFCHAIRITDPLSIKIAVGIVGGGLLLVLITAALIKLGELVARQREITMPHAPDENPVPVGPDRSESAGRHPRSAGKKQQVAKVTSSRSLGT